MKTTINTILAAIAASVSAAFLAGCATHGYGDGTSENFVRPEVATLTDLTRLTGQMVDTLLTNAAFKAQYKAAKSGLDGKLPAIQVGNFVNDVVQLTPGDDNRQFTPKLEICRGKAREALQNSELFRLVDDAGAYGADADSLNAGMVADVEKGLVASRNLQNAGNFTPPDFRMIGRFDRNTDGKRFYYTLEVRLYNLKTREFWTTTQIFDKF